MEFLLNLLWAVEIILLSSAVYFSVDFLFFERILLGYNSQHTPQQFGSGSSGYYQQGSVSDWGGQMDVSGGTNERNAAATRSFLGGGSNVGSSSTQWNSGGG